MKSETEAPLGEYLIGELPFIWAGGTLAAAAFPWVNLLETVDRRLWALASEGILQELKHEPLS